MIRECDFSDISDGKIYNVQDMVKCDTNGCDGCHKCCTNVGNTIVLNPMDINLIKKATGFKFEELLAKQYIELNMVDGLILPNIKMNSKNECSFLNENGRCTIHNDRPDICRLYPLGRIYNEDSYSYFLQKDECKDKVKTKIKIKKWIGVSDTESHMKCIMSWHTFIKDMGAFFSEMNSEENKQSLNDIAMYILNIFYVKIDVADYTEFNELIDKTRSTLVKSGIIK